VRMHCLWKILFSLLCTFELWFEGLMQTNEGRREIKERIAFCSVAFFQILVSDGFLAFQTRFLWLTLVS
jgi:hypothetical protein